jgi:hypothetical protein
MIACPGVIGSFQALQNAVDTFNREVTIKKKNELIERRPEFSSVLAQAQKVLEECIRKPEPEKSKLQHAWYRTKRGLEKFCKYAKQYSDVVDVMMSAHPEIAALACMNSFHPALDLCLTASPRGAMKFLLVVSVQHQELKASAFPQFVSMLFIEFSNRTNNTTIT